MKRFYFERGRAQTIYVFDRRDTNEPICYANRTYDAERIVNGLNLLEEKGTIVQLLEKSSAALERA